MPLNFRQQRFVAEYLRDLNAGAAAARAGYSARASLTNGPRLLKDPRIQVAVQVAKARRLGRVEIKQDDVLRDLLMRRDHPDTPPAVAVKVDELLMRHLGMLHDNLKVSGSIDVRLDRPALLAKLGKLIEAEQPVPPAPALPSAQA